MTMGMRLFSILLMVIIVSGCFERVEDKMGYIIPGFFQLKRTPNCSIRATVEIGNIGGVDIERYILPVMITYRNTTVFKELFEGADLRVGETHDFEYNINISCDTIPYLSEYRLSAYAIDNTGYMFGRCNPYKCESVFVVKSG